MGEEEESGGVRALRAWAGEAIGRAKALLPELETVARPSRVHDDTIAELDALSRLLDHDPELRSAVTVWLGGALTLRHAAGGGTPEDRERAHRLIRDARDPATECGAAVCAEDRRWAALFRLTHLMPFQEMLGGLSPEPDITAVFDMVRREGQSGMALLAAEVQELVIEAAELPLPPVFLGQLRQLRELHAHPSADGIADLFAGFLPDNGPPGAEQLRQRMTDLLSTLSGGAGAPSGSGTASGSGQATSDARPTPDAPNPSGTAPAGADTPGLPTPDEFRRMLAALQAVNTTSIDFVDHTGGGDPAALDQQLGRLRQALDGFPDGMPGRDAVEGMMTMLLNVSEGAGGTLEDQEAGLAHARTISDYFRRKSGGSFPMADGLAVMADVTDLVSEVQTAGQTEDVERLRGVLPKIEALVDTLPEDHDFRAIALIGRAMARTMLGRFTMDRELVLRGLDDFEEGKTAAEHSRLPIGDHLVDMYPNLAAARAYLTGDTTDIPDREVPPPGASANQLHSAASRLEVRFFCTAAVADRQGRVDPSIAAFVEWCLREWERDRAVRGGSGAGAAQQGRGAASLGRCQVMATPARYASSAH
ncbi:hypothetical protein ACFC0M_08895 [Streptomyces sp. NPDC056149]|uniref:hypothetical protein n=1 Tax=Streptomyces sp. NPDC056149 TaxID=3345728 RepID=UPI0035DC08CE